MVKVVNQAKTQKLSEDMMFCDEIAEAVMIPMIHNLAENDVDIKTNEFVQEVGFMNEVIKSMMYRHLGYVHPMQSFIKSMMSTKTEAIEDTYATFDHDMLEKMTRKLIEDSKEDNKEDD
tara:strand:- start:204 stop:560 length:357 start_codon:yes stop_codon:yes gene_type:complete